MSLLDNEKSLPDRRKDAERALARDLNLQEELALIRQELIKLNTLLELISGETTC